MKHKFIIIAVAAICLAFSCDTSTGVSIGNEGTLDSGANKSPVAITEDAFKAWTKAKVANDTHGMAQLMLIGSVFLVERGTRVLVIDSGTFTQKIRILGGGQTGRAGWVPYEYVK